MFSDQSTLRRHSARTPANTLPLVDLWDLSGAATIFAMAVFLLNFMGNWVTDTPIPGLDAAEQTSPDQGGSQAATLATLFSGGN